MLGTTTAEVSAIVPVHGRDRPLSLAVRSILKSEGATVDVILVDTAPHAGPIPLAVDMIGAVRTFTESERVGFVRAVNDGFRHTRAPYVLIGNDDLMVSPTYVRELVDALRRHPRAAVVGGKIRRMDKIQKPTQIIDSAGIVMGRNRRATNRGEGMTDDGRFDDETEVFGISGAGLMVRRQALDSAVFRAGIFDESFFMYKEDVDLAWRLRLLGWECWYVPTALAFHGRTSRSTGGAYRQNAAELAKIERKKPEYVRLHSMKNQWLMLVKNEQARNFARDAPWILAREALIVGYSALLEPRTLRAVPLFFRALPQTLADRRVLMRSRLSTAERVGRWFN
jgi:GT2 family glycosyltransferase